MGQLSIDRVQLEIIIQNDESRKRMSELESDMTRYQRKLRKLHKQGKQDTEEYIQLTKQLKEAQKEYDQLTDSVGIAHLSIKQLTKRQKELNQIIKNIDPNHPAYKKYEKQLQLIDKRLAKLRTGAKKSGFSLSKMADGFNRYAAMAAAVIAVITSLIFVIHNFAQANAKLSDSEADVIKTTELTKKEVRELQKEFKALNTRTPRAELMKLAEDAGRLGKKTKAEIMQFVEAGNIIKTALGDDLGEGAIKQIGKLTDVFKVADKSGKDYKNSMLAVGSAVNTVAASSNAEAGFMIDFSKRLGGVATQANISVQNILGYASALDSLGQTSELSSTAMSRTMVDMFLKPAEYAKIAGMETKKFTKLLNEDANEAFLKLLEGLNGSNEGFASMVTKMDALGVDGANAVKILSSLAANTDKVRQQQEIANKAFSDGQSVINEYNTKNKNLAGNLEKIEKMIHGWFVNSTLVSGLEKVVGYFAKWAEIPLSKTLERQRTELQLTTAKLLQSNMKMEDKKKLIQELKTQYPGYLDSIDVNNISLTNLKTALKNVNDMLINKIILQKEDEKIQKHNEQVAGKRAQKINKEDEINSLMMAYKSFYGYVLQEGISQEEQWEAFIEKVKKSKLKGGSNSSSGMVRQSGSGSEVRYAKLNTAIRQYKDIVNELNTLENDNNALLEKRDELMKKLGMNKQEEAGGTENKERDEKFINGILMVFKGGKWVKKETTSPSGNNNNGIRQEIDLEALRIELIKDKKEQEIAEEKKRHKEKLFAYKGNAKAIELENLLHVKKLGEIDDKYEKECLSANKGKLKKILEDESLSYAERARKLEEFYQQGLINEETYNVEKISLVENIQSQLESLDKQYNLLPPEDKLAADLMLLEQWYNAQLELHKNNEEAKNQVTEEYELYKKTMLDKAEGNYKKSYQERLAALKKALAEGRINEQQYAKAEKQLNKEKAEGYASMFDSFGQLASAAFGQQKAGVIAQIAFDTASAISHLMAASEGNPMNLLSGGAAGIAQFVAGIARITANAMKAKDALSKAKPVKQKAKGKYPVIGEDDGKLYYPERKQSLATGIITSPTLVAEEPEAVIDYKTLYNPQSDNMGMTVMDHFKAIKAIKFNQAFPVPQMATGKYPSQNNIDTDLSGGHVPATQEQGAQETGAMIAVMKRQAEVIEKLSEQIEDGLGVDYYKLRKTDSKIKKIEDETSL